MGVGVDARVGRTRGRSVVGGPGSVLTLWVWVLPPPIFGILTASDLPSVNYCPLFLQY